MALNRNSETQLNIWEKFFSVQYYKRSAKRFHEKKDGFLVIGSFYSILVDDESRKLGKTGNPKFKDLETGDTFVIELFQGELLEKLEVHEYNSGTCFLNL